jgi:hypothetical protein
MLGRANKLYSLQFVGGSPQALPGKFRDITSIKPRFPSKFFPVHQPQSAVLTASENKAARNEYLQQQQLLTDTLASLPDTPNITTTDRRRLF